MSEQARPRFLGRLILRLLCPRGNREDIEGDLLELYARREAAGGAHDARTRLRRDLLSLCLVLMLIRLRAIGSMWQSAIDGRWVSGLAQDVRYGSRVMRRQPAFSIAVVLTLAIGIGANAAIFSVVHAVLFKDLPYQAGDRFVAVRQVISMPGPFTLGFSAPHYFELATRQTALERIAAVTFNETTLTGQGEPEKLQTGFVSSGFFSLLGVRSQMGRSFRSGEDEVGHNGVALISHALWRRRFGADPGVLSRLIALSGRRVEIVGVLPADFSFIDPADVWVPLVFTPNRLANEHTIDLDVYGRLKPGADPDAAARALTGSVAAFQANPNDERRVRLDRVRTLLAKDVRSSLLLFWGAVGLVLLIACANVANLMLARAADRRREMAVRRALGVDASRLVRQLLIEGVLLSLCGGAAGLGLAHWTVKLLVGISPATIPRLGEIGIDPVVVAFTAALSLATGIAFGLVPALQAVRADLTDALRDGNGICRRGFRMRRTTARSVILVLEVAVTLVLLVGSGLLVRSFLRLQQIDAGFVADDVAAITVSVPISRPGERTEARQFFQRLTDEIAALAGVRSAGAASGLPLTRRGGRLSFVIEGKPVVPAPLPDDPAAGAPGIPPPPPPPAGQAKPLVMPWADAIFTEVTAGYFETMGIPVRDGRTFNGADRAGSSPVVIISDTMAKRYWPGERVVGRRLRAHDNRWKTIVGVVGNVRRFRLEAEALPEIYLPVSQILPDTGDMPAGRVEAEEMTVVARGRGEVEKLLPAMKARVYALNPDQPVSAALTLDQLLATVQAPRRFNMIVLTAFGAAAVLLTAVGLYGVMAYLVAQRRREIGIRVALGARRRHIVRLVAGEGLTLVAIGLAIGIAASLTLTRLIGGLLFGVAPTDPVTFGAVVLLLLVVSASATWMPARRAQLVDPVTVLRQE